MPKRRIIFVLVIFFSIAFYSVRAPTQAAEISRFNKKITEKLKIRWRSIEYEKTLYNPAFTSNQQGQPKSESLSLSCEIEMPNSGLVLAMSPEARIEQITDSQGGNVEFRPLTSQSSLRYQEKPRLSRGFTSAGLPSKPEHIPLRIKLDSKLPERLRGEFGLKGHFYALIAESLEYVELPFKPNDKWVRLTPDVEIRVRQARNEASRYRFEIEQRPGNVRQPFSMRVGDYLPSQLVVDRQIIVQRSAAGAGGWGSSGRIGGTGAGTGRAEKIRFTVAVNPTHQKIPVEFEQIPLSVLTDPAPSQTYSSNRTGPTPVKRMPEQVKPLFDKKVANCFKVNWNWITYSKTLNNPPVSEYSRDQRVWEKLSVCCEAEILDPRLVVGTCDIPTIEQITDGKGRETDISMSVSRLNRMYYRTPRYSMKYSPPSKLIQLEGKVRSALGLPLLTRHRRSKRSLELQPDRLRIQLDPGLLRQDQGEIRLIKGYFHALSAESFKHVKVPFESSDKWVRLTSDVEMQVSKVIRTGSTTRFEIKQRGQAERRASNLCVGDRLSNEIVVDRQFIRANGQPNSVGNRGGRRLPGSIGGNSSIGGSIGLQVEKIDYLIAVGPTYYKIPFEIEHIPLPEL